MRRPETVLNPGAVGDLTRLLSAWNRDDHAALEEIAPRIHAQLRRMAAVRLRAERPGHTLQTAGLVNETFLRLMEQRRVSFKERGHFYAVAGRLMGRVLLDHARRRRAPCRGGDACRVPLDQAQHVPVGTNSTGREIREAIAALAERAPDLARLVEMRYFDGLSKPELAVAFGASTSTIARRWRVARAWLHTYLTEGRKRGAQPWTQQAGKI